MIDDTQSYLRLKESIKTKHRQIGKINRDRLKKYGKRIGIDEIHNETESLKLRIEVQNLLKL